MKDQQSITEKFGVVWCDLMHDSPAWPIHGAYRCRTCNRRYAVPWNETPLQPQPASPHAQPVLSH